MSYSIEQHHHTDPEGRPAGGTTTGRGFRIDWQNGPLVVRACSRRRRDRPQVHHVHPRSPRQRRCAVNGSDA